ncbi:MAG: hypothetical protein ACE5JI_04540 [Acidobacteriota bacterium]
MVNGTGDVQPTGKKKRRGAGVLLAVILGALGLGALALGVAAAGRPAEEPGFTGCRVTRFNGKGKAECNVPGESETPFTIKFGQKVSVSTMTGEFTTKNVGVKTGTPFSVSNWKMLLLGDGKKVVKTISIRKGVIDNEKVSFSRTPVDVEAWFAILIGEGGGPGGENVSMKDMTFEADISFIIT